MKHLTKSQFANLDITDFTSASTAEILTAVREGMRLLNPMINTLYRHGAESGKIAPDAYESVMKSGGLFNTVRDAPRVERGTVTYQKTRNELLKEFARELNFIQSKTATLKGAKKVRDERAEIVKDRISPKEWVRLSQEEQNRLVAEAWDDFNRVVEENDLLASSFSIWAGQKGHRIIDIYNEGGHDPERFRQKVGELYEQYEEEQQQHYNQILKGAEAFEEWYTI